MDTYRAEWEGDVPWTPAAIVDKVPAEHRPLWAVGIVTAAVAASGRDDCAPEEVSTLRRIAMDPSRWAEARQSFERLREETLRVQRQGDVVGLAILGMAEATAKVTYNASRGSAPYDQNAGSVLIRRAGELASLLADRAATDALWLAISDRP